MKRGPTKEKKKYSPFSQNMKVKPGMSDYKRKP
jgi:hypothetical protein